MKQTRKAFDRFFPSTRRELIGFSANGAISLEAWGDSPRNLMIAHTSAEGAAHVRFTVNRAFSAGVFSFNESWGVCPRLEIELRAFGARQKP